MQEQLPLAEPRNLAPDGWTEPESQRVSARGVVVGAIIGLASGLVVNVLLLFALRVAGLPSSGQPVGDAWVAPLLLGATALGVAYYRRDD